MSQQAVFLFDMNAFHNAIAEEILEKSLSHVRIVCLRLLTELESKSENFRFGVKFYNQGKFSHEKDKYYLQEVTLENFENLEKKITDRYIRYASYAKLLSKTTSTGDGNTPDSYLGCKNSHITPVESLNTALKEILCDYTWNSIEIRSPVKTKQSKYVEILRSKYIFLFSPCPKNLSDFSNLEEPISSAKLLDSLMPKPLFKKMVTESGISVIWLDTSCLGDRNYNANSIQTYAIVQEMMTCLEGSIYPIRLFSYFDESDQCGKEMSSDETKSCCGTAIPHPILPFSKLFEKFISGGQKRQPSASWECNILLPDTNIAIKLVPLSTENISQTHVQHSVGSQQKRASFLAKKDVQRNCPWLKFFVKGVISRCFFGAPDSTFVCSSLSSFEKAAAFSEFMLYLLRREQYAVLECEKADGSIILGLLCPMSCSSGILAVYDQPSVHEYLAAKSPKKDHISPLMANETTQERFKRLTRTSSQGESYLLVRQPTTVKPFQAASMERWFVRTSNIQEIGKTVCKKQERSYPTKDNGYINNFMRRLQHVYHQRNKRKRSQTEISVSPLRRSPRLKRFKEDVSKSLHTISETEFSAEATTVAGEEASLLQGGQDKDTILAHLNHMYSTAIASSDSLYSTAHSIVNVVLCFLKSQQESPKKEELLEFMKDSLLITPKAIIEAYEGRNDAESVTRRTKEYRIQVLLNMEVEAAFPYDTPSNCAKTVISFLRGMLISVGHLEVTKFLYESIKDNYNQNLHHVLEEIEEELGVSIVSSSDSSSPLRAASPAVIPRSSSFSFGSVPSCKSVSSISSQKESKMRKRSDLSQTSFSSNSFKRQIMVPSQLLRKQKNKKPKSEPTAVRKSPRLNKRIKNTSASPKPAKVRRNLFCDSPSSRRQKDANVSPLRKLKPQGHHVLKTKFVPETPSPKQGQSSTRHRQAHLRRISKSPRPNVTVVSESPAKERWNSPKRGSFYDKKHCRKATPSPNGAAIQDLVKENLCKKLFPEQPIEATRSRRGCSKRLFLSTSPDKAPIGTQSVSEKQRLLPRSVVVHNIMKTPVKSSLRTPVKSDDKFVSPVSKNVRIAPTPTEIYNCDMTKLKTTPLKAKKCRSFDTRKMNNLSEREKSETRVGMLFQHKHAEDIVSSPMKPNVVDDLMMSPTVKKYPVSIMKRVQASPDLFERQSETGSYSTPLKDNKISTPLKKVTFSPDVKSGHTSSYFSSPFPSHVLPTASLVDESSPEPKFYYTEGRVTRQSSPCKQIATGVQSVPNSLKYIRHSKNRDSGIESCGHSGEGETEVQDPPTFNGLRNSSPFRSKSYYMRKLQYSFPGSSVPQSENEVKKQDRTEDIEVTDQPEAFISPSDSEKSPSKRRRCKKSFTPPTSLSLIHLTTSPVTFLGKRAGRVRQ